MELHSLALAISELRPSDLPLDVVTPLLDVPHDRFDTDFHHILCVLGIDTKGRGGNWKECRACQRSRSPEVESFLKTHRTMVIGFTFVAPSVQRAIARLPR